MAVLQNKSPGGFKCARRGDGGPRRADGRWAPTASCGARSAPAPPRRPPPSPARLGAALRGRSAVMDPSRVGPRAPSFTRFANHMLITLKWCSRYYPTVLRRKWRPEKSLARDTIGAGTGVSGTALLGPHPHSAPPPPRGQCQSP